MLADRRGGAERDGPQSKQREREGKGGGGVPGAGLPGRAPASLRACWAICGRLLEAGWERRGSG